MRASNWLRIGSLALFAPFALWGLASLVLGGVHTGERAPDEITNVAILIESNGAHVSFWFPARHPLHDWTAELSYTATRLGAKDIELGLEPLEPQWIAIGWGDRRFFLEVPTWQHLTVGIAFDALIGGGASALHVEHLDAPQRWADVREIVLSSRQYAQLVAYVRASFQRGADGMPVQIPYAEYGRYDAFYEGVGSYSPLSTCNEWVSRGLRAAGAPAGAWTPFAYQVLAHARELDDARVIDDALELDDEHELHDGH